LLNPCPPVFSAEVSNANLLSYFQNAIRETGCTGKASLHEGSFVGPIPRVTSASDPEFLAVKRAIQEIWRGKDGSVRRAGCRVCDVHQEIGGQEVG
jgi:hypothetical protein